MIMQSMLGLAAFGLFAWAISENRFRINLKIVIIGVASQVLIAVILLKIPIFRAAFMSLNQVVVALENATRAGTSFAFGYVGGGKLPFTENMPGAGFIFAFQALPLVLVISAISALLFYWNILPWVVRGFSWVLSKTMNLGGAEGVGVSANIFTGMVEAPLFIRPYLMQMTRSELFTLMTTGMATIAGTVMVLYASILSRAIPDILGHILIASIISVPAAITIAKLMVPETQSPTAGQLMPPQPASSAMDAITRGTIQGVELLINIVAMLIVLVALVHLVNMMLQFLPDIGGQPLTLQHLLGLIMSPVTWLMGIPWNECQTAGALMGAKTILNEFLAYLDLANLAPGSLSERSKLIMTYAMCGFANPGSLGIMIGGLSTMAPERRDEIVALGPRSVVAGTLATCMTGAVVGMLGI